MKIGQTRFGEVEGQRVDLFTLENDHDMTVKITNYGGIVTSIVVPDRHGDRCDVTCGFNSLDGYFSDAYRANSPYFGCVVGRYAARIKDGQFAVDGRQYQVAANDGPNHLHGGIQGFDKRVWDAAVTQESDAAVLTLKRISPDGEEGYPGTVEVVVRYCLMQDNELRIHYGAKTDRATPLSLTNHTYFNLNGFAENVLNHRVQLASDRFLVPDETNVPVGDTCAVDGTVCDFRMPKRLGDAFAECSNGFEHYYLRESSSLDDPVAIFWDPQSGRRLEVRTTEPGMLFYTGYYTSDELAREDGTRFGQFRAFCCETSKYPNGPNIPGSPRSILQPGQSYDETTSFRFSVAEDDAAI